MCYRVLEPPRSYGGSHGMSRRDVRHRSIPHTTRHLGHTSWPRTPAGPHTKDLAPPLIFFLFLLATCLHESFLVPQKNKKSGLLGGRTRAVAEKKTERSHLTVMPLTTHTKRSLKKHAAPISVTPRYGIDTKSHEPHVIEIVIMALKLIRIMSDYQPFQKNQAIWKGAYFMVPWRHSKYFELIIHLLIRLQDYCCVEYFPEISFQLRSSMRTK